MTKLTTVILFVAALSGCTRVAYINPERAVQQTDEWKTVQDESAAYSASRQPELESAKALAQKAQADKAPAADILAKGTAYNVLAGQIDAEVKRRVNAGGQKIYDAEVPMLEALAADNGADVVIKDASAIYISPKLDLSEKLAKRYNADQLHAMQAKVAAYEAASKQGSPPLAKK